MRMRSFYYDANHRVQAQSIGYKCPCNMVVTILL